MKTYNDDKLCAYCKQVVGSHWVKAIWLVPGFLFEHIYCGQGCKEHHRLQLIREAGL
jgi:hypothetical protein